MVAERPSRGVPLEFTPIRVHRHLGALIVPLMYDGREPLTGLSVNMGGIHSEEVGAQVITSRLTVTIAYDGLDGTGDYEDLFPLDTDLIRGDLRVVFCGTGEPDHGSETGKSLVKLGEVDRASRARLSLGKPTSQRLNLAGVRQLG